MQDLKDYYYDIEKPKLPELTANQISQMIELKQNLKRNMD